MLPWYLQSVISCFVFVESGDSADLYIAHSDVNDLTGLYRFGRDRLDPDDNVEGKTLESMSQWKLVNSG